MKSTVLLLSAAIVAIGCLCEAAAMPIDQGTAGSGDAALIPVVNGYGPLPYGLYGHRRRHSGRSYGTGYHGHGTRTGGPAGGLPSRN